MYALNQILVCSWRYKREHGVAPRGFGHWAFSIGREALSDSTKAFWVRGMYSDAVLQAKREAQCKNKSVIHVLS